MWTTTLKFYMYTSINKLTVFYHHIKTINIRYASCPSCGPGSGLGTLKLYEHQHCAMNNILSTLKNTQYSNIKMAATPGLHEVECLRSRAPIFEPQSPAFQGDEKGGTWIPRIRALRRNSGSHSLRRLAIAARRRWQGCSSSS